MTYLINTYEGTQIASIPDGIADTTTLDITLLGKNYVGYGEIQNENFIYLLENFAGTLPPPRPLSGQLWYNTYLKTINVFNGSVWKQIGTAEISGSEPSNTSNGSFWFNTTTQQTFVKVNGSYRFVGPETAPGFGDTRAVSRTIRDSGRNNRPIISLVVDNTVIAIISKTSFTIFLDDAIPGFNVLNEGITLSTQFTVEGNLSGLATSATKLNTARNINGVAFDGTSNITITAETPNSLSPGNGLLGTAFTGATSGSFSVDSASSNIASKIVVRDGLGNFSAGTITASIVGTTSGLHYGNSVGNVTGNLTGNVTGNLTGNVTGNLTGNVTGNASTSNKFYTPVKINGISFDGSVDITVTDATKLPLAGGTLTGALYLHQDPITGSQAATKTYVDNKTGSIQVIPRGLISMWYGSIATIPGGWALCDGANGTPDLRERFVMGAGGSASVGSTGGTKDTVLPEHSHSASFSGNSLSGHSHGVNDSGHKHFLSAIRLDNRDFSGTGRTGYQHHGLVADGDPETPGQDDPQKAAGSYTTYSNSGISINSASSGTPSGSVIVASAGSNATGTNLPPYYVLAYIMKL